MILKVFLLLLFSLSFFISEVTGQVLEERMHKQNADISGAKLNGKVKRLVSKRFDVKNKKLKFNLSLLNYAQEYYSVKYRDFNSDGKVTKSEDGALFQNYSGSSYSKWDYKGNTIKRRASSSSDTLIYEFEDKFHYTFNKKGQVVKVKVDFDSLSRNKSINLEEIEYSKKGKMSSLYILTDSTKVKTQEYFYASNDLLLSKIEKDYYSYHKTNYELTENYYQDGNKLDFCIHRTQVSSDTSIFEINIGNIEGVINGTYADLYYNNKGILKKTKHYKLAGENINGDVKYWKGRLKTTYRYKEKKKKNYILQKVKKKEVDGVSKLSSLNILDVNRNNVLWYSPSSGDLMIRDITYY